MAVKPPKFLILAGLVAMFSFSLPLAVFASTNYGSNIYGSGTYAGSAPIVTTDAFSAISQTGATLAGTITSIGSTSPSVRGFVYGGNTSYGATTTDTMGAPFSTGSFSATISSLTCNAGYHFAAYATSTNGIGYGGDLTFTTSACSSGGGTVSTPVSGGGGGVISGPLSIGFQGLVPATVASTSATGISASSTPNSLSTSSVSFFFARDLQVKATGDDVRALQQFLNTRGFSVALSGPGSSGQETNYFGPATQAALAKYQAAEAIAPAAGYFGPKTRAAMSGSSPTATALPASTAAITTSADTSVFIRDLQLGNVGTDVQALQRYLNAHGFILANSGPGAPGNETQKFGDATKYQLSQFQQANGIAPAAGYFGPKTRAFIDK